MNSVISAFKAKKNSINSSSGSNNSRTDGSLQTLVVTANNEHKQQLHNNSSSSSSNGSSNNSSNIGSNSNNNSNIKKKTIMASQDNGYQYLRHIREIDSVTKLLSPVVMGDELLETAEILNFHPNTIVTPSTGPSFDVVDHVTDQAIDSRGGINRNGDANDCNINGNDKDNYDNDNDDVNVNDNVSVNDNMNGTMQRVRLKNACCYESIIMNGPQQQQQQQQQTYSNSMTNSPIKQSNEPDDDESEHSITACTSTTSSSSSSEHSNSTVVHSPIAAIQMASQSQSIPAMPSNLSVAGKEQPGRMTPPVTDGNFSLNNNNNCNSSSSSSSSSSSLSCTSCTLTSTASMALCNSGPSSCSSTTSCDTSAACPSINGTNDVSAPSSPTLIIRTSSPSSSLSLSSSQTTCSEYVPAFLKSSHITLPIIMPNSNSNLASLPYNNHNNNNQGINSATSTPKHNRYGKPRLSLSRFINHSMPSVHGRPNLSLLNGATLNHGTSTDDHNSGNYINNNNATNPPKRPSTHQRNLSLDFRSMGILLPPVSQVTNTRINLTQHHRNRSLDSALQRIPEVEVSSPNAENDNTFCTPSLLGSTMCSKIVTTAANVTAALTGTIQTPAVTSSSNNHSPLPATVTTNNYIATTTTTNCNCNIDETATVVTSESLTKRLHKCETPSANAILHATPPTSATLNNNNNTLKPNTLVEPYGSIRLRTTRPKSNESERIKNNLTGTIDNNIKRAHSSFSSTSSTLSSSSSFATCSTSSSFGAVKNLAASNTINSATVVTTTNANNITSNSNNNNNNNNNNNKKREDLTSLGSDDSGIICGSDSDQISLNRIRHSHESLDSGEMDPEEECIDMLETNSMDDEYNMLQSDLCFYQSPETDCRTLRPTRKKHQSSTNNSNNSNNCSTELTVNRNDETIDSKNIEDCYAVKHVTTSDTRIDDNEEILSKENKPKTNTDVSSESVIESSTSAIATTATDTIVTSLPETVVPMTSASNNINSSAIGAGIVSSNNTKTSKTPDSGGTTPIETPKNEVLFRNFFGATKNVIFRTAQSIIENHEKKNAAKQNNKNTEENNVTANSCGNSNTSATIDQIKSPTEVCKKKEFFGLLSTKSNKHSTVLTSPQVSPAVTTAITAVGTTCTSSTNPRDNHQQSVVSVVQSVPSKMSEKELVNDSTEKTLNLQVPPAPATTAVCSTSMSISKSSSISSLHKLKVPGVVKCFIKERPNPNQDQSGNQQKTEKGPSGLLRFFESPVFNIHFAIHYLFYSKEPGVLSFIGNKIFSFPDQQVDLYIPQLIIMYIQMDELAEVLDPYLTIRCRKSVDFSLKCLWLLEAYNYQHVHNTTTNRKNHLALMKEIYSKKERKQLIKSEAKQLCTTATTDAITSTAISKKTHHRSQSDATVLLSDSRHSNTTNLGISNKLCYQWSYYNTQSIQNTSSKLCLGDLSSGRAFDNGCACFETVRGQVNDLLGQRTVCSCSAPKTAPQREFMKALINVGKNLTALPSKAEKTSALRMFLNLINKNLPARVWLPLYSDIPHHVVRITEEKTAVLNSKDKTPYIIYVEVVEVSDIYSSSLIPKMMPSLRHTKSEEHLECGNTTTSMCKHPLLHHHQQKHIDCSRTSSCSSHSSRLQCQHKTEKPATGPHSSDCYSREQCANINTNSNCESTVCCVGVATTSTTTAILASPQLNEDDAWSQEDDEITAQYLHMRKMRNNYERDAISQMSLDSCDSRDPSLPALFNIGDVRTRHCNNLNCENTKSFSNDPEDPSAAALKEPWHEKELQIRESSPYGHLSNWRLLSAIVKCGDDLRQELMATQLLQMFKIIWQEENVDLWVRPYKIVCLSNDSGLIEPILNTVSLHQIKKNSNKSLYDYFIDEYGPSNSDDFRLAQKNFVQSCAAYCIISYLLQVKDRHNGNILLHSDGHIIHIDFGFILNISPKNLGFEQSPFKLTPEFVDVMGGMDSEHWREFNHLLLIGMMTARKHMDRIINFVEIMRSNAQLPCFKNGCSGTVQNLRKRFHMNLTEQEMARKVEQLVQDSLKSLSTKLYDGYQYYTNGIL